ncbi:uncharacterized protein LOC133473016 isoform X1 [Phyllopteryx taeniolatus]|uniref:uncharacterized protein LOC133473016 isoform X1 n=1 Tax=Phyllopteryx taeniolatus TaxID=161469 RepID=UPI002AD40539|nr:uncharacterized protein LOC133473016 isoform X1 [Phyllopteryx taeniolatus]XP_061620708.1 uncharacterized protein LOC133473016 isoform X1 [Phyllopteryx taeniolatus]
MDGFSPPWQFSDPHHPGQPSFHLPQSDFQVPAVGYRRDSVQQCESQEMYSTTSFLSGGQRVNSFHHEAWHEAGGPQFYSGLDRPSDGNWEATVGQNLNQAVSQWSESSGDPQSWDFGSSSENPSPSSEAPWLRSGPLIQTGATQTLPSPNLPQTSAVGIQSGPRVLDSFPEAFLSHPKRSFSEVIRKDSYGPVWGPAAVAGEHFGAEKFFHPNTCSTSAPPLPFPHLASPSSHSPAVTSARSPSWGGDGDGALHFFASQVPSLGSYGTMWPFAAGSAGTSSIAAPSHLVPSSGNSSLKSRRAPRHDQRPQAAGGAAHRWKNQIYTGTPFPSILHSSKGTRDHYTPRPLLNPARQGTGLYSSLSAVQPRHEDKCGEAAWVNIGSNFQAELPAPCATEAREELNWEQFLWKSWRELRESRKTQEQVEKLLLMCNSSCLPGGGSNIELALHALHSCQADVLATLEKLLLTGTSPAGDYQYAGSDVWTESERSAFNGVLHTHGKNFSLIHKTVKTKTVSQCVEFYYLNNKLQDKQIKQTKQQNRDEKGGESEQRKRVIEKQSEPKKAGPAPPLANSFPCTKCGKMFYKVKSRNAHMKIHRKIPDTWTDRLKSQRLNSMIPSVTPGHFALSDASLRPPPTYPGIPDTQVSAIVDVGGPGPPYVSAFNQSWHSFDELQNEAHVP